MIVCPICMDTYEDADCYELPNCLHKCCKGCLVGTFQQKIIALQIDLSDFKCPMCGRLFTPDILPEFLPADLYKKYGDHALQFNKIFGLEDYELLTNCLNENCTEKYIIWKDAEYATCPTCNKKFCRKCQLPFHEGITCEVQKEIHKNATYNDLKEKFQVAKCPKCLNACQKISGCNFMYCICKANFCYLCDAPLIEAYHFSHWQNNDPFNSPCRIWQDGNWVDPPKGGVPKPEAKPAEKIVQVEPVKKDNDIPCPNCQSVSKEITQLIYYEKFVKCGSAKCRGQSFCLACKKEVKAFAILDHVDQGLKQFQCAICFSGCPLAQKYTFPVCKHSFCKPCLKGLFEQKIKEQDAKPQSYCCPQCSVQFDTILLQDLVSKKSFENFQDQALKYLMIQELDKDYEIVVDCFNDYCQNKFIIWKDAGTLISYLEYQFCQKCNKKYCRQCKLDYHDPKVIDCAKWRAQLKGENEAEFYKKAKNDPNLALCKCPHCGLYIQRTHGCNFMTCKCGLNFCFLCDTKLTKADHNSHFKGDTVYAKECRVWQDGKWIDRDKARPEPKQVVVAPPIVIPKEEPTLTCQNCGSSDKKITQYLMNNIYQCKSSKCSSRLICQSCKKIIYYDELADHLNSKFHIDNI